MNALRKFWSGLDVTFKILLICFVVILLGKSLGRN